MDRACENCRFCIFVHPMRGKEKPYCERHSKWLGDTLLCSEWEMVKVPKPITKADELRSMTDEELAEWMANNVDCQYCSVRGEWCTESEAACKRNWLDWLRREASDVL